MAEVNYRGPDVNIDWLVQGHTRLPEVLAQFGYPGLREGQPAPIASIMGGRDTICILPTSTGKTAVFVIPTLCMNWKAIIFSPLVALMRDQIQGLWKVGVAAGAVSGLQSEGENLSTLKEWMSGNLNFLYVAPERLNNADFIRATNVVFPDHVVLDEAHTLSQWSDNFRAAYRRVGDFIAEKNPKVVSAFTATAPKEVEDDIRRVLGIPYANLCLSYPRRTNLKLESKDLTGLAQIASLIRQAKGSTIVYCGTIKNVERLTAELGDMLPDLEVTMFHGQMPAEQKKSNQDLFMNGKANVVVATNAFGMGIDKPDIRMVIHYDMPGSPEQLAQEVGRAGRDGLPSRCITLKNAQAINLQHFFLDSANPSMADVNSIYNVLKSRANAEGIVKMTGEELAQHGGVDSRYIQAIMTILTGNNVVSRKETEEKLGRVKILPPPEGAPKDERFDSIMAMIREGGIEVDDGFIEFDLTWLVNRWGRTMATVQKYLRQWDKDKLISYIPPFRGATTQILGSTDLIDYDRLKRKAADDWHKFKLVQEYLDLPDDQKHQFLEDYFEILRAQ